VGLLAQGDRGESARSLTAHGSQHLQASIRQGRGSPSRHERPAAPEQAYVDDVLEDLVEGAWAHMQGAIWH